MFPSEQESGGEDFLVFSTVDDCSEFLTETLKVEACSEWSVIIFKMFNVNSSL